MAANGLPNLFLFVLFFSISKQKGETVLSRKRRGLQGHFRLDRQFSLQK
jgi:hypothetical protein